MAIATSTECRVYRNLHNGLYSVQQRVRGKGWRVAGHRASVYLTSVLFRVSDAGRSRVLREKKKKNVHAFVIGVYHGPTLVAEDDLCLDYKGVTSVTYNPYKAPFFFEKATGGQVRAADEAWVTPKGVFVRGVKFGPGVASV